MRRALVARSSVTPLPQETRDVIFRASLAPGDRYVTLECTTGAHHACPGGLRTECQVPIPQYRCRCVADGCGCNPAEAPR
jgi:hypothetical protein